MNVPFPTCPLFVLIVEDNDNSAHSLAILIRYFGHEAIVAHDGPEAVDSLRVVSPDVILMDIGLPCEDGYALTKRLCGLLNYGPLLVAVTGYGDLAERSKQVGFHYHFEKPIDPQHLGDLLDAYAYRLFVRR